MWVRQAGKGITLVFIAFLPHRPVHQSWLPASPVASIQAFWSDVLPFNRSPKHTGLILYSVTLISCWCHSLNTSFSSFLSVDYYVSCQRDDFDIY